MLKLIDELRSGTVDEFREWLGTRFDVSIQPNNEVMRGIGFSLGTNNLQALMTNDWKTGREDGRGFRHFGHAMVSYLDTETRLSAANPISAFDAYTDHPSLPLHALYWDAGLEQRLCSVFNDAFGEGLAVDRQGGNKIALRCGAIPEASHLGGHFSTEYAQALRDIPTLHEQGDGVRSFVACLIHTEVLSRPLLMIDEPEAFLHPPQASQLGNYLAKSTRTNPRQIIVATHSADIVRGALDSGIDINVIRLVRDGNVNRAASLPAGSVAELWKDPLLRASNLFDGLFHETVVLSEGDADCRFYSAILDRICAEDKRRRTDVLFAHTGGKHRLAVAIGALRAINVPTVVVGDLDVLSEERPLRDIWVALGQDWTQIESDWRIVKNSVDQTRKLPTRSYVADRMKDVLSSIPDGPLELAMIEQLRAVLRADGGWPQVKKSGVNAIPKGQARTTYDALERKLAQGRLHLVPVGELEGFVPGASGHGPGWLEGALSSPAPEAMTFVRKFGLWA